MNRLQGKTAIVTGATSGMGKASAKRFAAEGAKVVFTGLGDERGYELQEEIRASGGEALFVPGNLLSLEDIDTLVNRTVGAYGTIDVLYGNAGASGFYDFHEIDMEKDYQFLMDLHVRANFYLTRQALPYMLKKGSGSCVYTISLAAEHGLPRAAAYSASKAALKNMVKSLAMEYGRNNIRFNGILPGTIYTEMAVRGGRIDKEFIPTIPLGRGGEPEEVANAALFFASDESSFCTGSMLLVDGGQSAGVYLVGGQA